MPTDYQATTASSAEPIPITLYPSQSNSTWVLLVGGSGDTRESFASLAAVVSQQSGANIITFTFRGRGSHHPYPLSQQRVDLCDVLDYLIGQLHATSVAVVCTSQGAYSTSLVLASGQYNSLIRQVIYMDPADYPLSSTDQIDPLTLSGLQMYSIAGDSAATTLQRITHPDLRIDVAFFDIRNFGRNGYVTPSLRGVDDPQLFTRLNKTMVRSFYDNTPAINRGQFTELHNVPHAFTRDGDVAANITALSAYITSLLHS